MEIFIERYLLGDLGRGYLEKGRTIIFFGM